MAKKTLFSKTGLKSLFSKSEANLKDFDEKDSKSGKSFKFPKFKKKKKADKDAVLEETDVHSPKSDEGTGEDSWLNVSVDQSSSLYATAPRSKKGLYASENDLLKPKKFGTFSFGWKKKKKRGVDLSVSEISLADETLISQSNDQSQIQDALTDSPLTNDKASVEDAAPPTARKPGQQRRSPGESSADNADEVLLASMTFNTWDRIVDVPLALPEDDSEFNLPCSSSTPTKAREHVKASSELAERAAALSTEAILTQAEAAEASYATKTAKQVNDESPVTPVPSSLSPVDTETKDTVDGTSGGTIAHRAPVQNSDRAPHTGYQVNDHRPSGQIIPVEGSVDMAISNDDQTSRKLGSSESDKVVSDLTIQNANIVMPNTVVSDGVAFANSVFASVELANADERISPNTDANTPGCSEVDSAVAITLLDPEPIKSDSSADIIVGKPVSDVAVLNTDISAPAIGSSEAGAFTNSTAKSAEPNNVCDVNSPKADVASPKCDITNIFAPNAEPITAEISTDINDTTASDVTIPRIEITIPQEEVTDPHQSSKDTIENAEIENTNDTDAPITDTALPDTMATSIDMTTDFPGKLDCNGTNDINCLNTDVNTSKSDVTKSSADSASPNAEPISDEISTDMTDKPASDVASLNTDIGISNKEEISNLHGCAIDLNESVEIAKVNKDTITDTVSPECEASQTAVVTTADLNDKLDTVAATQCAITETTADITTQTPITHLEPIINAPANIIHASAIENASSTDSAEQVASDSSMHSSSTEIPVTLSDIHIPSNLIVPNADIADTIDAAAKNDESNVTDTTIAGKSAVASAEIPSASYAWPDITSTKADISHATADTTVFTSDITTLNTKKHISGTDTAITIPNAHIVSLPEDTSDTGSGSAMSDTTTSTSKDESESHESEPESSPSDVKSQQEDSVIDPRACSECPRPEPELVLADTAKTEPAAVTCLPQAAGSSNDPLPAELVPVYLEPKPEPGQLGFKASSNLKCSDVENQTPQK
ncbi:mucin-17-like [Engraulis encrasicolus]|uniref:mucin-17-like n=1 Tax=Engraulis encrasicolus TaxID=184585 RepID=UPI002FD78DBF